MKDVNSELQRLSNEVQGLKAHNRETKRLIKDCFCNDCFDVLHMTVYRSDYEDLIKHVNKRKL